MNLDEYYKEISFLPLKEYLRVRGVKMSYVAERAGKPPSQLSNIVTGTSLPMTDIVASICSALGCLVSDVVAFNGIEVKSFFKGHPLYELPKEGEGVVTYRPFWDFMESYKLSHPGKTENDFFDKVEPMRRLSEENRTNLKRKMLAAKGLDDGHGSSRMRGHAGGLSELTRRKIRNDRPISIRTVYNMCRVLGCTPDWVMSYK